MQEFFSLEMFYDVLCCFTSMSFHRHDMEVRRPRVDGCGAEFGPKIQKVLYDAVSVPFYSIIDITFQVVLPML